MRGRAGLGPAGDEVAEVGERVADRRHLPVEDRDEPRRRVEADHDVAEAVVAVHDRGGRAVGHRRAQRLADLEAGRQLARGVDLPEPRPPAQLALEVAGRLAQGLEAARAPVDGVQLGQRVHELEAEAAALGRRVEVRRQRLADDRPDDLLHDVERRADHAVVLAHREDPWNAHAAPRQAGLDARLADHVVRGGRQRGRGRAAHDDAGPVALDEVGQVRGAVADPRCTRRPGAETLGVEERLELGQGQELRRLDRSHAAGCYPGAERRPPAVRPPARGSGGWLAFRRARRGRTVVGVQLSILGPVLVDGRPPSGAKERALLARLLVAPGTPVAADALVEAAWPRDRRDRVMRSLHVRLAKLRALLEPDRAPGAAGTVLVREPSGYRLTVPPEALDGHRFLRLADEAPGDRPEATLARCDEALALWRGEPFADIEISDVATTAEARRLHAARDRLLHLRALALRELGRAEESAAELEALVSADPLREELVRDLMLARYGAGRHAGALDAYRELARRLGEVGLQPSPEIRELEARILRHADELAAPAAPAATSRPGNIGARVATVVGRDDELAAIATALEDHRIVTLVGPAGVGKTTLAAEAARALGSDMPHGTWLVELTPLRAADEVLPVVGTTLGMRRVGTGGEEGDRDALGIVRERLRDARVLLVLDRAEHLVPDLGTVASQLASAGPGVAVLVTSRRPLGVAGEAVVPVAPLDTAAAERLFLERARAARSDWTPAGVEADAVAAICRRVDGLPLALELAAGRLRALSAASIAERLRAGLAVLGRGTLDASIEASHALLDADARELYRRLSVFAGPFRLEDAERVGGGDGLAEHAVLDLLVTLTEHSMLQAEGDGPRRYRMLEALRDHGRAQLDDDAAEAAARRHATHFAQLARTTASRIDRDGAEAVGDPLVPFQWDLHAAFDWAVARGRTDVALDLATGLGAFHHLVGTVTLGRELIERALGMPGGDPRRRIEAMRWQIGLLLCELRLPAASAALAHAQELVARHGGPREADQLRAFAAQLALCQGDLDAAEDASRGVHDRAVARGERFVAAYAAWTQGTLARVRGDAERAIPHLEAACDHLTAVVDVCGLDNCAAALAEAAAAAGRTDEAAAACERTLAFGPERPLGERNTYLLHEAALAAARAGDLERATALATSALTGARRDPVSIGPWHAPAARGDVALAAGDTATARAEYEQALALATRVRDEVGPSLPVDARLALSHLRLAEVADSPDEGREHLETAVAHARASRAPALVAAAERAVAAAPASELAGTR
jgi:predicted ATPase/DNA-binding SARP family transcriptional activator